MSRKEKTLGRSVGAVARGNFAYSTGTIFAFFMKWGFLGVFMVQIALGAAFFVRHMFLPMRRL